MTTLTSLLQELTFPEGPRWHDGRLWLSEIEEARGNEE